MFEDDLDMEEGFYGMGFDEEVSDSDRPFKKKNRKRKPRLEEDDEDVLSVRQEADDGSAEAESYAQYEKQLFTEQNVIEELDEEAEAFPDEEEAEEEEHPEKAKLKREIKAQALARLEDGARDLKDFQDIIDWWDKNDRARERRERRYELLRSGDDLPLDFGARLDGHNFPNTMNEAVERQVQKGEFIEALFDCPYELHELVTEPYIALLLYDLPEKDKELLYQCAVRQYSSVKIAAIRGQSDRNVRKVRATMLKRIQKKLLQYLSSGDRDLTDLTLAEKHFLKNYTKGS